MSRAERPLSPHLQVYRLQLTSVLSILHRVTGVVLGVGTLFLVWWLAAAAVGPECFTSAQAFIGSVIGRVLLLSWVWALFYHLCNGIRHLFWDAGVGYELTAFYRSGWAVVVVSVGLTLLAFVVGYASRGGS